MRNCDKQGNGGGKAGSPEVSFPKALKARPTVDVFVAGRRVIALT